MPGPLALGTFHRCADRATIVVNIADQCVIAQAPTSFTGNDVRHPENRVIIGNTNVILKSWVAEIFDETVPLIVVRVSGGIDIAHENDLGVMECVAIQQTNI